MVYGMHCINPQLLSKPIHKHTMPFKLQVEITDVSGKNIEGPVLLDIIVIDQNDNRPIFREGPYVGHVMEGSPTGSTVMRMMAFDADDPGTDNALLRYNILKQTPDKPSPNMFFIDPEKGDIVTVVSPALLDREVSEQFIYLNIRTVLPSTWASST
ncbi:E3 ubiquitin-protein ligase RNF38 [Platysternon megacephalum]|uniref:E3 ubiquitin-protein ligase RNF38 n=1 Tax=Platysternon megacephalum TaxID=55544 RepID=A0A4D9EC07_9SAUR|nr:E3 ubiquitin-protein ligase RNF38 [Platysternon megacephalum]